MAAKFNAAAGDKTNIAFLLYRLLHESIVQEPIRILDDAQLLIADRDSCDDCLKEFLHISA